MNNSRDTFGPTFAIARAAALVLHVDVALILLRKYSARFMAEQSLN